MNYQELEPSVEVVHLRRLLDTQPGCLMRIAADGTVLAANDAAVALLGVGSRADVLGRDFAAWIPEDQRDRWIAFSIGVTRGAAASTECEITAASGERRASLLNAVPLLDHPDGVASMAVAIRGLSHQRQVEATIVELEEQLRGRDADRLAACERLAEVEGCRRELAETLASVEARAREREQAAEQQLRELRASLAARDEALDRSDAAQRDAATALQEARQSLAAMGQREQAAREQHDALQARLNEVEAARQQGEADREALQARLDEAEAARTQREAEHDALQARLNEVEAAHQQGEAERETLRVRLEEAQAACDWREAERAELQSRLAELMAAAHQRDAELRQLQAAHAELAAAHAGVTAEHDRLVGALREQAMHLGALASGLSTAAGARPPDHALASAAAGREEERA